MTKITTFWNNRERLSFLIYQPLKYLKLNYHDSLKYSCLFSSRSFQAFVVLGQFSRPGNRLIILLYTYSSPLMMLWSTEYRYMTYSFKNI